jgi:ubiquinone/menaquinone biosynthesis C-methylase UbiE
MCRGETRTVSASLRDVGHPSERVIDPCGPTPKDAGQDSSARADTRQGVRELLEQRYADPDEPWDYKSRAAEILRHEWVSAAVGRLASEVAGGRARVLDVGCSLGQISERLVAHPIQLSAIDVSVNAVRRAAGRLCSHAAEGHCGASAFVAGSAVEIPIRDRSFDIVVASDGVQSWDLPAADRADALVELRRVLDVGGRIIFTEHTRSHRFDAFVAEIRAADLEVDRVEYLYDRPWYQFESWTRAVQHLGAVKALRRNLTLARILRVVGRALGPSGSRHVCVLARRAGA